MTGSSVVNGLDQLVKETTIFWDYQKSDVEEDLGLGCFVRNVCFLEN